MKKHFEVYFIMTFVAAVVATAALFTEQRAFASRPDAKPSEVEISIDNFSFTPATITVNTGTQITWTNRDDIPHTVMSSDNAFKSKALDTDDKFSFTPTKTGTYTYFCSLHPKMTATVIVQ